MPDITLDELKNYLDVIHDADDEKLQMLLTAAEDEAMQFMDRKNLTDWRPCCDEESSEPVSEMPMPASVKLGILILVQASYQAPPTEQEQLRRVAETKLFPYRRKLGV